jgi:hypothetical protein
MPLGKLRQDYVPLPAAKPMPPLTGNIDSFTASPSPARALQQQLEMHASEQHLPDIQKWSPRRALAFIVMSAAALWMALIVAGAQVVRAIA